MSFIFLKFHDIIVLLSIDDGNMFINVMYLLKCTGSLDLIIRSIITITISKDVIIILIDQNHFDSIKEINEY